MTRIALKIVIPNHRGSADGVSACLDILRRHRAGASFVAAPEQLACLANALAEGHETGLLSDLRVSWWRKSAAPDAARLAARLTAARQAFRDACGAEARLHASVGASAAMPELLRLTQRLGFSMSCDTRGRSPFVPVWNGEIIRCLQLPITLPTIDELGRPEIDPAPILARLLELTAMPAPAGHLFSLGADRMDAKTRTLLESLLTGWREQGHEVVSVQTLAAKLDMDKLPRHEIVLGTLPGSRDAVPVEGEEFLSDWRQAA